MDISTAGKKLELDGKTLLITYWNVDKQLEIMAWITKNFGDQILSLFMDGGDITDHVPNASEDLSEGERVNLAKLITDAFKQLPPKEYAKYAKYIVCDVLEGSKKINMERMFRGKMVSLHVLIFEVLRYNFSDFLGESEEAQD